jgi:uncharacterized membrane protein
MMMGFSFFAILLVFLGGGLMLTARTGGKRQPVAGDSRTPREILDERLAQGEISGEEYRIIRAQIER